MNIVIPMAGRGQRFRDAGYTEPKPLIPIHGIPMIRLVINNVQPQRDHRFIFICQQTDVAEYGLRKLLSNWAPGCAIIELTGITEGAACTVLEAQKEFDMDAPLMIANSDQWVDNSIDAYLAAMDHSQADGFIMTMKASGEKWSYIRFDSSGKACEVLEKQPVSDEATVGIYNYRRAKDFVADAQQMIEKDLRVNEEFYVAPVYNQLLGRNKKLSFLNVGRVNQGFYGLGTPQDLTAFVDNPISRKAVNQISKN